MLNSITAVVFTLAGDNIDPFTDMNLRASYVGIIQLKFLSSHSVIFGRGGHSILMRGLVEP